jgi:uncharacterized membrane protein
MAFTLGLLLFGTELGVYIFLLVLDSSLAAEILSMISANHLGGRLAFIGVGLEFRLPAYLIIYIIIFYNTTYLLIMNFLIVYFWERTARLKIINNFIGSLKKKAITRTQTMKKWNWISISLFVWLPFPMTGAVTGSVIAHIEGYNIKDALLMVIPSMWIGVICWTLWFDELYKFFVQFGKGKTIFLTLFLLILPLLFYLGRHLKKVIKGKFYE